MPMKKLQLFQLLISAILLSQCVFAGVEIYQVLYDPLGSENGGEAILLYNQGSSEVNISSWFISSGASDKDATLPSETFIYGESYYLIADSGWSAEKDNASWPDADYEETLNFYNSDSGITLKDASGNIIDSVGWGNPQDGFFDGSPAADVSEGKALLRTGSSGNNANDFIEAKPNFNVNNITYSEDINLSVEVQSPAELNITIPAIKMLLTSSPKLKSFFIHLKENQTIKSFLRTKFIYSRRYI